VSVGALRDWLAPVARTVLDGVRHVSVSSSHSGLLVDDEVAGVVDGLLRAPAPRQARVAPDVSVDTRVDGTPRPT